MSSSPRAGRGEDVEPPAVPGFRTWRAVYVVVLAWFALVVAALTAFTKLLS